MNKTLSVNIGGMVFHVEENAYKNLNSYLDAIRGYFTASDGRDEIIQDIEARIAEMFQEQLGDKRQVVTYIIDEQPDSSDSASAEPQMESGRAFRRLYRDPDDRIIGGVCAGISHYIGLDPIWIRLAFAASFFIFGSGFLLYLLLIIIMPKAVTPSEKLEMKGEKVSLSNLKKSFHDEASSISKNAGSGISRFFDALGQLLTGLLKLIGKVIAVFFLIIGVILFGSFVLTLLALIGIGGSSIPFVITDLFMSPWQQTLALIGGFLVIGIPILVIISKAIQVLFKLNYSNKALNWLALALWIVGLGITGTVAGSLMREYRTEQNQRIEIPVEQPVGDTLYIEMMNSSNYRNESYYFRSDNLHSPWGNATVGDSLKINEVQLDIIRSSSSEFELIQISKARGKNGREAINNARKIEYKIIQQGSSIKFDESFSLPTGTRFRGQEIQLLLKVPEGKTVFLSPDMHDIIYDIENVTNTYDGDMVNKGWTMTPYGLECMGCDLKDFGSRKFRSKDNFKIKIDENGVIIKSTEEDSINGEDVNINISSEGINIESN